MPTQRDVATLAGVSSATVSRFLSNPKVVSPAVAQRIQDAIDQSGYMIDYSAQCLKTGRYNHVGIVAPGIGPFYWEIFYAIQACLGDAGYFTTLFYTRDLVTKAHTYCNMVPPFLKRKQLDGIFFFPTLSEDDDALLEQLRTWGRPFIVLDRPMEDKGYVQMHFDNYLGGRKAAEAFLELGHRDFLFIRGIAESPSAADRYRGFKECLAQHGISLQSDREILGNFYSLSAYNATMQVISSLPPFTAVFAANDSSAVGFMRAAKEYGLTCPSDFSIIGFDDTPECAPYMQPSLSSFRQPISEFGHCAAQRMIRLLNHEEAGDEPNIFLSELFRRESLAPPPRRAATA